MSKFGEGLTKVGEGLITHLTIPLAAAGAGIIKLADKASDLNEAQNVIENTFKSSAKAIEAWTNTTATSAGISKTASSQWVGFMGAMLKSSGVTEKASGDMSKKLVQLTGDMSSFYNISTSDMWEKIRSGISGETMPLKQLGINMDVANLSAYALSQGITKSYKDMSQAEQTTLRYNYLLSVTKDAQGDFGRTLSDSFANQARVAKLNLENLATTLGSKFLPAVMQGTKGLNDYLVAMNNALKGENESSKLGGTINNIANAISKLTPEKIKSLAGIGAALAGIGPGLFIFGKLTTATGEFEKGIGKTEESVVNFSKNAIDNYKKFGESATESMTKISKLAIFEKMGPKIKELGGNLEWLGMKIRYGSKLSPIIDGVGSKISGTISKLSGLIPSGVKKTFENVSKVVGPEVSKIGAVFADLGGKAFSGLKSIVGIGLKMIAPAALIGVLLLGLGVAEQKMGTQLDQIIANITQKGPQLIKNFTSGLLAKIPDLIKTGTTLLMNLINAITANAPAIITAAVAIITSLVNGVATNLPRLIPVVLQLIQTIIVSIVDNLPKIILAGLNLLVALAQGISNNIDKIVNVIVTVVTEVIKVLAQNGPLIIEAGIKILVALIEGISKAIPQLIAALPKIVQAIWDGLKGVDWGSLGSAILDGILDGLKAAAKGIGKAVQAVGNDIKEGFKAFFGIHSPSRLMRDEVGKNISLGIAEGINDVDFMQTISDTIEQSSDKPAEAAKKVADLVSQKVQSVKDTLKSDVKSLNTELEELNDDEGVSLRGKKGSEYYAIQDEYTAKKKAITDEIALRKDQADKEINEIQRIGKMSKDELQQEITDRKTFIDSVNTLSSQLVDALKAKYTDEEKTQEDTLNQELDNLDKWKDESEKRINSVYDAKIQAIEDSSNAQIEALQAESDALDQQTAAEDRASKHKEFTDKISDLQSQIQYEHNDYNKEELQKQLDQEQSDYEKELKSEAISDKKDSLKQQMDEIKNNADNQKKQLETEKQNEIDNMNNLYNLQKDNLNKRLDNLKSFYDNKLSDANLNAEAEKMVMQNNQNAIVELLNSYGEQYKAAGQTLGDRLSQGFEPAIDNIKSMIASITAEISAARDSALSDAQVTTAETSLDNAYYPNNHVETVSNNDNSKTTVTNNFSFTHNSPTKATPSEERKQDESLYRKAIFTVS